MFESISKKLKSVGLNVTPDEIKTELVRRNYYTAEYPTGLIIVAVGWDTVLETQDPLEVEQFFVDRLLESRKAVALGEGNE